MKDTEAGIRIHFKDPDSKSFLPKQYSEQEHNTLVFKIQPNEGIALNFWVKKPGLEKKIEQRMLTFNYADHNGDAPLLDAYERIIFDCIAGDQTLFATTAEVRASWKFITPILKLWEKLPLVKYKENSNGPYVDFLPSEIK